MTGSGKTPNWVEIGTLLLAILMAVGGFFKFAEYDSVIKALDSQLKADQVRYGNEKVLQIRGQVLEGNSYDMIRIDSLMLELENIRQEPVDIEKVVLTVNPIDISTYEPTRMAPIVPVPPSRDPAASLPYRDELFCAVRAQTAVANDDVHEGDEETNFGQVTILSINRTDYVLEEHENAHTYLPSRYSGGRILGGQKRQIRFDLRVREGKVPSLHLLWTECWLKGVKQPFVFESWLGLDGFPSRRMARKDGDWVSGEAAPASHAPVD